MATKREVKPHHELELAISYLIDAPVEKVYGAWTDAKSLPEWFCPKPWSVTQADLDVRAGGSMSVIMKSPEGVEYPSPGLYLEIIPNKKLVWTNALVKNWVPNQTKPMIVASLTFENEGGKTKYTARCMHWTKEACDEHQKMGFEEGWGICVQQLEAHIKSL